MNSKSGYSLSRAWFDFAFENQECKCTHTALYLWIVELNNRLGWKEKFGLPTSVTMEGLSIGNRGTYKNALDDLERWGFIKVLQKAKNSSTSCIIEVCQFKNEQALIQALDQAMTRQSTGIASSTVPIDKQVNKKTIKQSNKKGNTPSIDIVKLKAKESFDHTKCQFGNDFKIVWLSILQEPKWKIKTQTAINKSLEKLMKYEEEFAINLIEAAIAGGWQGVCFSDTDKKYESFKNGYKTASQLRNENRDSIRNLSDRSVEFLKLFSSDQSLEDSILVSEKIEFESFWNKYDKKIGDKEVIQSIWNTIPLSEQKLAIDYIPKYIQAQPEKRFRKNPENYLISKAWNDELIITNEKNDTRSNPTARSFGKL